MPQRLPLRVIILSIVKFILALMGKTARMVLISLVWLIVLPCTTSVVLSFYLGWNLTSLFEGQPLSIFFHTAVGTMVTLLMLAIVLGLFLLREYMETHRLLCIRRNRRRERPVVEASPDSRPNGRLMANEAADVAQAAMSDGVAPSETSMRTAATRNTDRSSWMQTVVPREYRAYLRRRELYRSRCDKTAEGSQGPEVTDASPLASLGETSAVLRTISPNPPSVSQSNNALASVAKISITRPSVDSSIMDALDDNGPSGSPVHRRRILQPRDSSRGESAPFSTTHTSSVSFRDNIRCKICSSVVCINKEHVVQASVRIRNENHGPAINQTLPVGDDVNNEAPIAPPVPEDAGTMPIIDNEPVVPPEEEREDLNRANMFNWNADFENNGMTLSEFLGLSGSLFSVFQNALTVLCCNSLIIHAVVFVPHLIGKYLHKMGNPGCAVLSRCVECVIRIGTSASTYSVGLSQPESLLPVWLTERLGSGWEVAFQYFLSSLSLLTMHPDSIVQSFLQYLSGCIFLHLTLHTYRMAILRTSIKFSRLHRAFLETSLMINAFWKTVAVLAMELVFFPILFGWLIHLCLSPLVATSYTDRIAYFQPMPVLLHLIHWTIGTIVLVKISLLVKWLRESCRPGLLYFIRNSTDPEMYVIKDIIETPTPLLVYRFALSVAFYSVIIIAHFGGFVFACVVLVPNLVPLNLDFRHSLNQAPIDLLLNMVSIFLHKALNTGTVAVLALMAMKGLARLMRLSSYFFGGRYLNEEDISRGKWVFVPDSNKLYKAERLNEVMARKVEAWDVARIEIMEGREKSLTPIVEMPLEPRRPLRFPLSGRHSEDAMKGFTVVYRPDQMKIRVFGFFVTMCAFSICLGLVFVVAPILLGRYVFSLFHEADYVPPDIKCYEIGIALVILLIKAAEVGFKTLYERGIKSVLQMCLRVPVVIVQSLFVLTIAYVLWPSIVGAYLLLLFSPLLAALDETPVIPMYMAWLIGFLYCQLFVFLREALCSEERNRIIARLEKLEGWYNMEFKAVCSKLLIPYSIRIMAMIMGPPLAVLLLCPLMDYNFAQIVMFQRWSYAVSLAVPGAVVGIWSTMKLRRRLLARIRDENYLVGRRLHNLDRRGITAVEPVGSPPARAE